MYTRPVNYLGLLEVVKLTVTCLKQTEICFVSQLLCEATMSSFPIKGSQARPLAHWNASRKLTNMSRTSAYHHPATQRSSKGVLRLL